MNKPYDLFTSSFLGFYCPLKVLTIWNIMIWYINEWWYTNDENKDLNENKKFVILWHNQLILL